MKRLQLLIALTIISISFVFGQTRYVKTALNLRNGPGTGYGVITVLPRGTAVTIDEDCDCKWVLVSYGPYIGYLRTSYLSKHKVNTSYRTVRHKRQQSDASRYSSVRYYTNSYGNRVQSPTYYDSKPLGATALCRDGTYSFSKSRRGACSHHGGVARWY